MRRALCWSKLLLLLLPSAVALAQVDVRTAPKRAAPDTLRPAPSVPLSEPPAEPRREVPTAAQDGAPQGAVAPERQGASAGVDSLVIFSARDSMEFDALRGVLILFGQAQLRHRQQQLTAERIELWLEQEELRASGYRNSSGELVGAPVFQDGAQEYTGEHLRYSFRTRRGLVTAVRTQVGEGFYRGERIKQVEPGVFYVQYGCYTTCDAPHPHFYFCSPRMKLLPGDRVFADPLILYVADVPLLAFPFGLFFPNRGGRQSGILAPSFFFGAGGELVLQDLGYFFAASDYWDVQLRTTLRTRQGVVFHSLARYALRDWVEGSLSASLGWTRPNLDSPFQRQWNAAWRHQQRLTPQLRFTADVTLSSPDYFRNVSTDLRERLLEQITSTVALEYVFESGASLSLSGRQEQSLSTGARSGSLPNLSLVFPQWTPLRFAYGLPDWVRNTSLGYRARVNWSYRRDASGYTHQSFVEHNPELRLLPRLGYFSLIPRLQYRERWYFRRLERLDSVARTQAGFFREYAYSFGMELSTRLYGVAMLPLLGMQAFRHVLEPGISLTYTPAFPQFYGTVRDPRTGRQESYSRFALDGGGFAPQRRSVTLDYRILNGFEAKPKPADPTAPLPEPIQLLRVNLYGSYLPLQDSLRWSDLNLEVLFPSLTSVQLQLRARGTLYDEDVVLQDGIPVQRRVNRFLFEWGRFPLRFTWVSLQAGMAASGELRLGTGSRADSVAAAPSQQDWFADSSNLPLSIRLGWRLGATLSLSMDEPLHGQRTQNAALALDGQFQLGRYWNFRLSGSIDLRTRELLAPIVEVSRDLHCWELRFQWYPLGLFRGYYLRFAPKASPLREFKYEERTIPGL
jgi:hypothetical protein